MIVLFITCLLLMMHTTKALNAKIYETLYARYNENRNKDKHTGRIEVKIGIWLQQLTRKVSTW